MVERAAGNLSNAAIHFLKRGFSCIAITNADRIGHIEDEHFAIADLCRCVQPTQAPR